MVSRGCLDGVCKASQDRLSPDKSRQKLFTFILPKISLNKII